MFFRVPVLLAVGLVGCAPSLPGENWSCDFDASVTRPLAQPDAQADDAGGLPLVVCQDTCGPPAHMCTLTSLDGGVPAAVCPVCTF